MPEELLRQTNDFGDQDDPSVVNDDEESDTNMDDDVAGWQKVADEMHTWHPDLQEHARRNLIERGFGEDVLNGLVTEPLSNSNPGPTPHEFAQAIEAVALNSAIEDARDAANQVPQEKGAYGYDGRAPRAETFADIAHLSESVANDAFAAVADIKDDYDRKSVLERMVPLAVETGRINELIDLGGDGYHSNSIRELIVKKLTETNPEGALAMAADLSHYTKQKVFDSLLKTSPGLAADIYEQVQIAIQASEQDTDSDNEKFNPINNLVALGAFIPEAGKQAIALLADPNNRPRYDQDTVEGLAALSQTIPEAIVLATDLCINERKPAFDSEHQRKRSNEAYKTVYSSIEESMRSGNSAEALASLALLDPSGSRRDIRGVLVDASISSNQPLAALEIARLTNMPYQHIEENIRRRAFPLLVKQGELEAIKTDLAGIQDPNEKLTALVTAACYVPELLPEAQAAYTAYIEATKKSYDDPTENALKGLDKSIIDPASLKMILETMPKIERHDAETILASPDTPDRETLLAEARELKSPSKKIWRMLRLGEGDQAITNEALGIFQTEIGAKLPDADRYSDVYRDQGVITSLVERLEKDDRHDEARQLASQARHPQVLLESLSLLTPADASEAVDTLMTFNDYASNKPKVLNGYIDKLVADMSDDQLEEFLAKIPEDSKNLKAMLFEDFADRLIVAQKSEALFGLIPDNPGKDYLEAFETIIPMLIENPGQPGLQQAVEKIIGNDQSVNVLLPLVETHPNLTPIVLARALELDEEDWRTAGMKSKALQALIPFSSDAATHAADYVKTIEYEMHSGRQSDQNKIAELGRFAGAFAKSGYGSKAMSVVHQFKYASDSQKVFRQIAADLTEHGSGAAALEYARKIKNPRERALCLAVLIPSVNEETLSQQRELTNQLFGPGSSDLTTHEQSDRSVNYNLFIDEMGKNSLIVDGFLTRASNPAEILRIMEAVDKAADTENGTEIQIQALNTLVRLNTDGYMQKQWSDQLQEQSLGGEKADADLYKNLGNLKQLSTNLAAYTDTGLKYLLHDGYSAVELFKNPWLINTEIAELKRAGQLYPFDKGTTAQQEWLADHAFVKLEGFNRRAIGQIIQTRLANNLEYSLHDASQWLEPFAIPQQREIQYDGIGPNQVVLLKDEPAELNLLASVFNMDLTPDELRRLPGFASANGDISELKTQKFEGLFTEPAHTILYAALLQQRAKQPGGRPSTEEVEQTVEEWLEAGVINEWVGKGKEITVEHTMLHDKALYLVDQIANRKFEATKLPAQVSYLREVGKARTDDSANTLKWIRSYQNLPGQKLAVAWANRIDALADGVEDKPAAIEQWMSSNVLRTYMNSKVDDEGKLSSGVTPAELMQRFPKFLSTVPQRYGPEVSMKALERLNKEYNAQADLPAREITLQDGSVFKIFAKDDSEGMTLGYDTKCCMTLGGASESCIYDGYSEPSMGFVGLYDSNNNLMAQSFVFHNEGVLVPDNIEPQRGHDLSRIQGHYTTALTQYLKELHVEKPELGLRAVHIGTGYLADRLSQGLKSVESVRAKKRLDYSDADNQLELFRLTDEELNEATPIAIAQHESVADEKQPVRPTAHPEFSTTLSIETQMSEIALLESQIYPEALQTGLTDIESELSKPNNFSFLIGSRDGNSGTVGYAIAYKDQSADAVYISDLAVLPAEQKNGYGIAAIDHLIGQIDAANEKRILFEARESTSYQALQSPNVQAVLARHGFDITRSEKNDKHFDNGEGAYTIEIVKTPAKTAA